MTFPNMGPEASEKLRSIFPFHLLLAAVLLIFVYMIGGGGVGDPDIWWHLKNAQYLFTTGKLPSSDMYSFTVAGHPWSWVHDCLPRPHEPIEECGLPDIGSANNGDDGFHL